jgi:alpha-beta hydrolase superfamily lysophospholipase
MTDVADHVPPDPAQAKRRLVVVVPSIHDRFEPWASLVERLKTLPGYDDATCDWHFVHHGADFRHRGRAKDFGVELAANIHQQWVVGGGYDNVVLVGHSLGGVLVRYAYLHALGTFDPTDRRPWAAAVERVVLFASLNRGIEVSFRRRWWLPVVAWLSRFLPVTRHWLAHDLLRGSDFITNLRIAWLREINALSRPPLMVQYLGRSDSLVSEEDSRDIDTFATGTQELVPDATHADLIRLDTAPDPDARFALIARAFTDPRPSGRHSIGDPRQRVVIVLHGIRANNDDWPRDLERLIEADWPGTEVIAATYGRFSARKFMIPATRRKYLSWMQDTYAERLAANPRATFHFIGHSNGTYLLGHSLEKVPAMRFERIMLAGSVLPTTYDWQRRAADDQVRALRNDRAAHDVPVGVLCSALRGLHMTDVGTGGVDGFRWEDPIKTETYYYKGGHSAALTAANLPHLAAYVMDGTNAQPPDLVPEPSSRFSLLSRAAPHLARLLVLLLLAGAIAITLSADGPWSRAATAAGLIGAAITLLVILDLV